MPAYDYRCRTCDDVFEVQRSMHDQAEAVRCPAGHADVTRVFAVVGTTGRAGAPVPAGGGCCGGACGCG